METTNTVMETKKITKRENINSMLQSEVIKANPNWVAYLEHELELLDKKSSGSKKLTATQEENIALREVILEVLENYPEGITVTELMNSDDRLPSSTQKMTANLLRLSKDGLVENFKDKKKSLYKLK